MREIKFRAWDSDKQRMIYSTERQAITMCCTVIEILTNYQLPNGYYKTKITYSCNGDLMQYTGLKDKNGKEIYEGDILFGREEGDGETTAWKTVYYTVFFDIKEGTYKIRQKNIKEDSVWCDTLSDIIDEYEVIGNKFENPELMGNIA